LDTAIQRYLDCSFYLSSNNLYMDNLILDQPASEWQNPKHYLATKGDRFLNLIIDRIVILAIYVIVGVFLFRRSDLQSDRTYSMIGIYYFNLFFFVIVYYSVMEAVWGKSVGKMLTKTKIVTTSGKRPELISILGRSLCRYIPLEPFSVLFSDLPQGWHDSIPRILVVDDRYPTEDEW